MTARKVKKSDEAAMRFSFKRRRHVGFNYTERIGKETLRDTSKDMSE